MGEPSVDPHARLRRWTLIACAFWLVLAILPYLPPIAPHRWPNPWRLSCITLAVLGNAALMFVAARRAELGRRLRQAIGMMSISMLLVVIANSLIIGMGLPPSGPALSRVSDVLELAYSGLGLMALFWMPLAPLRRKCRSLVAVDIAIAVGGLVLVLVVSTTLVNLSAAQAVNHGRIIQYGLFMAGDLVALNILLIRGLEQPVPSAIRYLAATVVLEIAYLVIAQVGLTAPGVDKRPIDVVFAIDQVCYALAALAFLRAPVGADTHPVMGRWTRTFNPLPAVAVVAIGGLLVHRVTSGESDHLTLLTMGMVGLSLLLVIRVMLAANDRTALLRAEAETAQRLQADRVNAVRRLAGGIAHEFNNLMTTILGNAELGLQSEPAGAPIRIRLQRIQEAGYRAADLTARLLTYAGGGPIKRERVQLADLLATMHPRLTEIAGPTVAVHVEGAAGSPVVYADRGLIEQAVLHVTSNARTSMPHGGEIRINLRERVVGAVELAGAVLPVPAGRYSTIEISDTGVGIPSADLPRVFDPFYSSWARTDAQGLGLAVVHGAMAAHGGGVSVKSTPGHGTTIQLLVPVAGGACTN